jgi:serine protease Do
VVGVVVGHDRAWGPARAPHKPHFTLGVASPAQGQRLFSLGNPHDLGLSIVEGTYNGLVQHTLYPRIHLTAPINPGMSGGPTIDESGRVVGVNVATAGEEVGFLVPVERATALLRSALTRDSSSRPTQSQIGRQLRHNQDEYLRDMLGAGTPTLDLGPFKVVTQPAPYFHCWGSATRDPQQPYEMLHHNCSMDEDIYLDEDQTTGTLGIEHQLIRSRTLNMTRFYARYATQLGADDSPGGDEEYVTSWECVTRNVRNASVEMRAVTCLRRYKKLGELYDAHVKLAVLGRSNVGLISTMNVTGATYDNVTRLAQRFLDSVSWR